MRRFAILDVRRRQHCAQQVSDLRSNYANQLTNFHCLHVIEVRLPIPRHFCLGRLQREAWPIRSISLFSNH
jgi:hypothetical protein